MFTSIVEQIYSFLFSIYWILYLLIGIPLFLMKEGILALIDMIR